MNIFATYSCPVRSARSLDDQRVVKMILEGCQMLATAAAVNNKWTTYYPHPTHQNHPCLKWVADKRDNFLWLLEHVIAMDAERKLRWDHDIDHVTLEACLKGKIQRIADALPVGFTPHPNCARNRELGVDYTHIENVHLAYRLYLRDRWLLQSRPAMCTIKGYLNQRKSHG